jgi:hypothetical protein
MEKKYFIENVDGIVEVRFLENPDAQDICDSLDDAAQIHPNNLRLWDFSNGADLASQDIEKVAAHAKTIHMQSGKVAIVAPKDLTYGLFRMYEVHRHEERIQLNVFRSKQAAREWLRGLSTD